MKKHLFLLRVLSFFIFLNFPITSFCYVENEADYITISANSADVSTAKDRRYLLYEVNFGEGFNLRRDVYMRVAQTVQALRQKGDNYVLVLPPWGNLYHWRDRATRVPWRELFDLQSLNLFVPVIEFEEFLEENGNIIDHVVYLQHYAEGWNNGQWEEKFDVRKCINADNYYAKNGNIWKGFFYSYDIQAKNLTCLSIQGEARTLANAVSLMFSDLRTVFIDRAETVLHNSFGNDVYWRIRRSMRYASHLLEYAEEYRQKYLDSNHDESWVDEYDQERTAVGGNYIAAHLRRQDFVRSHDKDVPSLEEAAIQLKKICDKLSIKKVFVATDADENEIDQLSNLLSPHNIELFSFTSETPLSDGAVSIIDQIIASKARYFIGTHSSTFSYRIREDREIMHFSLESTFNDFCKYSKDIGNKDKCEQPAKWKIVY
uniref:GDP-fucose protein O-fucosyltransferase 2 n=1 Tax=Panagrolaimus sp. ES5 TaxID=591445 RepID=A0AC34F3Y1_9BILA